MKTQNSLFVLLLGVIMLFTTGCKATSKGEQVNNPDNDTIEINSSILSDKEKLTSLMVMSNVRSGSGLINLDLCHTTHKYLHIAVSSDRTEVRIYMGNELLQDIKDEEGLVSEVEGVWYLDANFDGYTDIFIGTNEPRNHNALLLWNPNEGKFQRVGSFGEPGLHGFMLHTPSKSVIESEFSLSGAGLRRSTWRGNTLQTIESLEINYSTEDSDGSKPYEVRDAHSNVIAESYSQSHLSQEWQLILKAAGFDQKSINIGIDIVQKFCNDNPHQAKIQLQGEYSITGRISYMNEDAKYFTISENNHLGESFSIDCKLTKYSEIIANSHMGDEILVSGKFTRFYSRGADFEVTEVSEVTEF